MKFLADENMRRSVILWLRSQGHDVLCASDDYAGFSDENLLAIAENEQRILLTHDTDFGELIFSHRKHRTDVILFRFKHDTKEGHVQALQWIFMEWDNLSDFFVAVTDRQIRVKKI